MPLNSLGVGFVFTAKDMASPVMRKVERNFKSMDGATAATGARMNKAMMGLGVGFATAAVGAIGLGAAAKSAKAFGTFEQELAKVGAITRATSEGMADLRDRATQAGIETQFSPDEAVQGLTELGLRGFTTKQSIDALQGSLDFAAGAQIGVAQGSSTVAAALKVFSLEADQASASADKLLKISNITAIQGQDLELMLGTVSRGASAAGQSLDEMLVSMGLVKNTGVDASVAASSVSSALQFIAKNQDDFKQLGVSVTDANGNFRDFGEIVLDTDKVLRDKLPNAADQTAKGLKLFGRFGVTAFQAMRSQLNSGIEGFDGIKRYGAEALGELRREMEESAGTAEDFKNKLLDTFEGQKTLLQGSLQTLKIALGEGFAAGLRPVVEFIRDAVNGLIAVFSRIPAPIKKALSGVFIAISGLLALAGVVIMAVSAFALLKMAIVAFAGPLMIAAKAIAVVGAALLAVVAIFKTIKLAYDENVGGLGEGLRDTFGKVQLFFDALKQLSSGGALKGDVLKKLLDPANAGVLSMVQRFQQAKFRIKAFFGGMKDGFKSIVRSAGPTFARLKEAFAKLGEVLGFGGKAMGLMTTHSSKFGDTGQSIGQIIGRVMVVAVDLLTGGIRVATIGIQAFKAAWVVLKPVLMVTAWVFKTLMSVINVLMAVVQRLSDAFFYAFDGIADFVSDVFGDVIGFIDDMINAVIDKIYEMAELAKNLLPDFAVEEGGRLDQLTDFIAGTGKTQGTRGGVGFLPPKEDSATAIPVTSFEAQGGATGGIKAQQDGKVELSGKPMTADEARDAFLRALEEANARMRGKSKKDQMKVTVEIADYDAEFKALGFEGGG